jgi:hypothetical protein
MDDSQLISTEPFESQEISKVALMESFITSLQDIVSQSISTEKDNQIIPYSSMNLSKAGHQDQVNERFHLAEFRSRSSDIATKTVKTETQ